MRNTTKSVLLGAVAVAAVLAWIVVGRLREPPPEPVFGPPPATKQQSEPMASAERESAEPAPAPGVAEEAVQPQTGNETAAESVEAEPEEKSGPPEDPVVRLAFVDDLARLTVENYYPARSHPSAGKTGVLLLSLKTLNMRYGTKLVGLAHATPDMLPARQEIFRHILSPAVLRFIQAMYADRFAAALGEQAATAERTFGKNYTRVLNAKEIKEMYGLTAVRARELGACLQSLAGIEDLDVRVETYLSSIKGALDANERFREFLDRYQELRSQADQAGRLSPDAKQLLDSARADMEQAGDEYEQALARRERLKSSLAGMIKRDPGAAGLSDGEALYAAQWVYRRLRENPDYREAVATAGLLLKDLSIRLEAKAK